MRRYLQRLLAAFRGRDLETSDLRKFNLRYSLLESDTPSSLSPRLKQERERYLQEELDEFKEAVCLEDMADALIDLVYIAKGTAVMMGLPWEALWDDVQRANMAKEAAATARSPRDVIKPIGWVGPDNWRVLDNAGWRYQRGANTETVGRGLDYSEFKWVPQ